MTKKIMMTTKKITMKKNKKTAIGDIFQLLFGLLLLGIVFAAMIISQYDTEKGLSIWAIIMGIAGIISLVEIIIRKAFNKQSIAYSKKSF